MGGGECDFTTCNNKHRKGCQTKIPTIGQLPIIGDCWCSSALVGCCMLGMALCWVSVVRRLHLRCGVPVWGYWGIGLVYCA